MICMMNLKIQKNMEKKTKLIQKIKLKNSKINQLKRL